MLQRDFPVLIQRTDTGYIVIRRSLQGRALPESLPFIFRTFEDLVTWLNHNFETTFVVGEGVV
jgi:hypothetical protein